MKKLIFTALVGLAMIGFTGCTTGNDASAAKCQSSKKCDGAKKCGDAKKVVKKCDGTKKCTAGKCGGSK